MSNDDGFLSRWSRRKAQVRQGVAPLEPSPAEPQLAPPSVAEPTPAHLRTHAPPAPLAPPNPVESLEAPAAPPLPTLDEVAALPPDSSDFSRFVAPQVSPEVRNAAMKKLFSAPHFNVMDGLDVYIDDYSQPDPLPAGMLRQLAQSQLLGLFAEEPAAAAPARTDNAQHEAVATQTRASVDAALPTIPDSLPAESPPVAPPGEPALPTGGLV